MKYSPEQIVQMIGNGERPSWFHEIRADVEGTTPGYTVIVVGVPMDREAQVADAVRALLHQMELLPMVLGASQEIVTEAVTGIGSGFLLGVEGTGAVAQAAPGPGLPSDWSDHTALGDYRFVWGEEQTICFTGANVWDDPESRILFTIQFADYAAMHPRLQPMLGDEVAEWRILVPDGPVRAMAIDCPPYERDQMIIGFAAINAHRKLGLGKELKW